MAARYSSLVLIAAFLLFLASARAGAQSTSVFQIVRPDAVHESLEVVEEGLAKLSEITEPITIIGVVGGFHTGKSFLCNVLNGTTSGFEIGPTHEATTHGLWLGELKGHRASDGSRVLLLDTEGFSARGVAENYDAQVFSVALLLSSHLIYNSVKLIDAAEVEYLEILARRAHLWSLQSKLDAKGVMAGDGDATSGEVETLPPAARAALGSASTFPALTWVVEDFFQDLGATTPTEWLLSFLSEGGARRPLADGNYTLERLFGPGKLSAHTLYLPAASRAALQSLNKVRFSDLDADFREQAAHLRTALLAAAKAKPAPGRAAVGLTGAGLAALTRVLVASAAAGHFPTLPSLWHSWEGQLVARARDAALGVAAARTGRALAVDPPLPPAAFAEEQAAAAIAADAMLRASLFGFDDLCATPAADLARELKESGARDAAVNAAAVERTLAAHALEVSAETAARHKAVAVPQPPAQIAREADDLAAEAVAAMKARAARYAGAPQLFPAAASVVEACAAAATALRLASSEAETAELDAAALTAYKVYQQDVEEAVAVAGGLPAGAKAVASAAAAAQRAALSSHDDALAARGLSWLAAASRGQAAKALLEKRLAEKGEAWSRDNEGAAAERCADARREAAAATQLDMDRLLMPKLPEQLRREAQKITDGYLKEFEEGTVALADTEARRAARAELVADLKRAVDTALKQNKQHWHARLTPVSVAAMERLNAAPGCAAATRDFWALATAAAANPAGALRKASAAVWACACEAVPWVHEADAVGVWKEEFEKRRTSAPEGDLTAQMSPETVAEVARLFVTTDCAKHRAAVFTRFFSALFAAAALLVACLWLTPRRSGGGSGITGAGVGASGGRRTAGRQQPQARTPERGAAPTTPTARSRPAAAATSTSAAAAAAPSLTPSSARPFAPRPPGGAGGTPGTKGVGQGVAAAVRAAAASQMRFPPPPLQMTVDDMEDLVRKVKSGDGPAATRMLNFHKAKEVPRDLLDRVLGGGGTSQGFDARVLAQCHERVVEHARRSIPGSSAPHWSTSTPYVDVALRKYAEKESSSRR